MKQIKYENNKEYKRYLENQGKIKCSRCPYHRVENATRLPKNKSWKDKKIQKSWLKRF